MFNLLEAATHTHAHTFGLACMPSVFPATRLLCSSLKNIFRQSVLFIGQKKIGLHLGIFAPIGVFSFPGSSGGICEKSKLYSDGKKKSLNTGIITVQNYASHVPPKVSHITFAHEVGHNFGSPVSLLHASEIHARRVNLISRARFVPVLV